MNPSGRMDHEGFPLSSRGLSPSDSVLLMPGQRRATRVPRYAREREEGTAHKVFLSRWFSAWPTATYGYRVTLSGTDASTTGQM